MATPDPVASTVVGLGRLVAEGAAKFIERVRNREVGGSSDPQVIALVKIERLTPEYDLLRRYIRRRELRVQTQLGLVLRKLGSEPGRHEAIRSLKATLRGRFGLPGLHAAELVGDGIVTDYLRLLIEEQPTEADVSVRLEDFLLHADRSVFLIDSDTSASFALQRVRIRLMAQGPGHVALFAKGTARSILRKVLTGLVRGGEPFVIVTVNSGDKTTTFVSLPAVWFDSGEDEPPKGLVRSAERAHRERKLR